MQGVPIMTMLPGNPMSDEKPDPLSDVIKGLGLILRAAKTTVERMPKKGLEDAVLETAREVGRAIENVAGVVEREVLGRREPPPEGGRSPPPARPADTQPGSPGGSPGDSPGDSPGETGDNPAKAGEGPPKPPDAA